METSGIEEIKLFYTRLLCKKDKNELKQVDGGTLFMCVCVWVCPFELEKRVEDEANNAD